MSYAAGSHYHVHCIYRPDLKAEQEASRLVASQQKKRLAKKLRIQPQAAPPTHPSSSTLAADRQDGGAVEDLPDPFKDPAKLVLVKAQEAQRNRKQAETRIALDKIHDRIQYTLNEFEGEFDEEKREKLKADVNLEVVDDPAQLYELLSDSRLRSKYQQNLTVFIVGYEEKCEDREKALASLQEFFEETQSGGTQQLLDELESEEVDFDEVTAGLESAMETAQNAAERLIMIKKDMSQLIAIVAAFPDTKKGRKKMEKALLKAQEDVEQLTTSLDEVKGDLEQSQEKCDQLHKLLDAKTEECGKLRPLADKTKLLQVSNDAVKKELDNLKSELEDTKKELRDTKRLVPSESEALSKAAAMAVDQGKLAELENQLMQERERYSALEAEKDKLEAAHQEKMDSLRAEHESEVEEMRGRYEEQMKSLMEDDLFDDEEEEGEGEEEMDGEEGHMADESFLRDIGGDYTGVQESAEPPAQLIDTPLPDHPPEDEGEHDTDEGMIGGATPCENKALQDETDTTVDGSQANEAEKQQQDNEQGSPHNQQQQAAAHSVVTTPTGTPPQKLRPSSPPTSTASGSPAGSVASSVRGRRMSKAVVGRIQKEFESREKKLKHDLDEVKAKSRKAVTSLKAQLAEAQNRHGDEMEALSKEMSKLRERLERMESENVSLTKQVETARQEKDELSLRLKERDEQSERFKDEKMAESGLEGQRSDVKDLPHDQESPRWSEHSEQLTPRSMGDVPVLTMNEVFPSGDGQSLASGSLDLALQEGRVQQYLATPLDQSLNSAIDHAPLGSPLQSASLLSDGDSLRSGAGGGGVAPPIPMQYSLGMLAHSRLSHHSPGPHGQPVGFDHPVVMEWSKAYDSVIKFKDNLIDLLSETSGPMAAMADDLRTLELHRLDRSGDVQGQITEMRFSLALMLHQIEQTLQDTLSQAMDTEDFVETDSPRDAALEQVDGGDIEEFRKTVARLKDQLREGEHTHRIQLQESRETIANLSSKVENLKIEMAKLRQTLPPHMGGGVQGVELEGGASIMFTRLDAERNARTLQGALEKEWISPSLYHNVTSNMEDYLTIAGQRLAVMADRCRHRVMMSSLLHQFTTRPHLLESEKGSKFIRDVRERERVKQLKFTLEMDRLTAKRTSLAHDITHTLQHIEKKTGIFLVKPIYARSGYRGAGSLITPIDRPLPLQLHPPSQSRPRTRLDSGRSTPHPSMKLVNQLVKARQEQTQRTWHAPPTNLSGSGSPPTHRRQLPSLRTPATPTGDWCVGDSRIPPTTRGQGFLNSLAPDVTTQGPLMPRIMEMDILKNRQPDTLLGHLLPDLLSRPSSKVPPYKLNPLDNSSLTTPTDRPAPDHDDANQLKTSVHFDVYNKPHPGHAHLPPIRVPSRTDHDRPLPVH